VNRGKITLEELTQRVKELPALPAVVQKVMELTEDPRSSAQDIEAVLKKDQSLTAEVLRLANSAFYGIPRRISTVSEATVFLGFKTVKSVVLTASCRSMMQRKLSGYFLERGELWKHSLSAALSAQLLSKKVKFPHPEAAYTAGLLHDIGKLILDTYLKESYQEVLKQVEEGEVTFLEAEEEILGFNHAAVGARLAERWGFPSSLTEAIGFHHQPEKASEAPKLCAIVHLADWTSVTLGFGMGVDGFLYRMSPQALEILQLEKEALEHLLLELFELLSKEETFSL
jgi:putative nucleotidyltransferase with HDIG domain